MADARLAFTQAWISSLTPGPKRQRFHDSEAPGLTLTLHPTGKRAFYFYRKIKGKPEEHKLGDWPDLALKEARRQALAIAGLAASGTSIAAKKAAHHVRTLEALFAWYLTQPSRRRARSPVTEAGYQHAFKAYLSPWASREAASIGYHEWVRFFEKLASERGPVLSNRVKALVRAMYNKAIAQRLMEIQNPVAGIEGYPEESRERHLAGDELARFLAALEHVPSQPMRTFFLMSLLTGARKRNLLAMRWEEIDLTQGIWRIPQTKSGRPQLIPLLATEVALLSDLREAATSPWVFPAISQSGHMVNPSKTWRALLDRAGIEDLHLHDLRRSLGSLMAAANVSLPIIGKALGHTSPAATAIYARLNLNPVREAKEQALAALPPMSKLTP